MSVLEMIRIFGDKIFVGEFDLEKIVENYDTPFYIYDLEVVERRFIGLTEMLRNYYENNGISFKILYALKANSNPDIVSLLRILGSGFDAASPWEAETAIELGARSDDIYITAPGLSKKDLMYVVDKNININIDSMTQLNRLIELGYKKTIGVRINPGFGAGFHRYATTGGEYVKFGINLNELDEIIRYAYRKDVPVSRIHSHIGSGIMDPDIHLRVLERLLNISIKYEDINEIDLGGGFGISYDDDRDYPFEDFLKKSLALIKRSLGDKEIRILIEPGRYIVARSGLLVARVTDVKKAGDKTIILIDTGFNHFMRPVLYGARHRVLVLRKINWERKIRVDIYGNLCESTDFLGLNIDLPKIDVDDIIIFMDTGAYGYSMASTYNLRPLPLEIIVYKDKIKLSRERFLPKIKINI
jgi:diaminopimelate decarboxylase